MAKEENQKKKAGGGNGNTGAVMVVGAGIAGIQASLDLAKAGSVCPFGREQTGYRRYHGATG